MTQYLMKKEKDFLKEMVDEFLKEAKDVEEMDSQLTQNLARFIHDDQKVQFLETLQKKIKNLPEN